jgi:hypothetical protein
LSTDGASSPTAQLLAGVNTRHGPRPPAYPSTVEVNYVAAVKKADVDGLASVF